jgi:hypothetical protein
VGAAVGAAVTATVVGGAVGATVVGAAVVDETTVVDVVVATAVVVLVAGGFTVVVSTAELFDADTSPNETGGTIVTDEVIVPVAVADTAELTVNTADVDALSEMDRLIGPEPVVDPPHESPGATVHAQIVPV